MSTFNAPDGNGNIFTTTVTIANGASLSNAVDLTYYTLLGVLVGSAWTAANMTFQVSPDNSNWGNFFNTTGEIAYTAVAANECLQCDPAVFAGVRFLKVRSGTSGTPVNQGQAVTLTLILRGL